MIVLGVFIFSWMPDSFVQFFQFRYMCNRVHWIVVQADGLPSVFVLMGFLLFLTAVWFVFVLFFLFCVCVCVCGLILISSY